MGKFIKENLVLVSGIVLPVLLVVGFLILSQVPKSMLNPPEYDFVISAYRHVSPTPHDLCVDFEVEDGKLRGRLKPEKRENECYYRHQVELYRYDADADSFEEIVFDLPDGLEDVEKTTTFPIEEAKDLTLDKKSRSNDGYTFEYLGYRGNGGLLGEMFGMRRRHHNQYVLSKNGTYFELPELGHRRYYYYGNNIHFLGWVVPEGEAK